MTCGELRPSPPPSLALFSPTMTAASSSPLFSLSLSVGVSSIQEGMCCQSGYYRDLSISPVYGGSNGTA